MSQVRQPPRVTRQLAFTDETFDTFYNRQPPRVTRQLAFTNETFDTFYNRQPPRITRQLAFTSETFDTFYNKLNSSYVYIPIIIDVLVSMKKKLVNFLSFY